MKNPFIAGNWVRGENFFGREELLEEILSGRGNACWVTGTRRQGKTSLLKQLEFLTRQPPLRDLWLPLFWDMQGAAHPEGLADTLTESVEDAAPAWEESGVKLPPLQGKVVTDILRELRQAARRHSRTLLLLCDECEELLNIGQEDPQCLSRLRRVFHQGEDIRTVICATPRLMALEKSAPPQTSPFLAGFLPPLYLSPLSPAAAQKLMSRGGIDAATAAEIQRLTGNHPFLLQVFCRSFWEDHDLPAVTKRLYADQTLDQFFEVDFALLEPLEQELLMSVSAHPAVGVAELAGLMGRTADQLSTPLYTLEQLGMLCPQGEGWAPANIFLENWLQRVQGRKISAEERTPAAALGDGEMLGHYRIGGLIGSGGMGRVFAAEDQRLGRRVAVKTLLPENAADANVRARFFREAKAASLLHHTNIVTLYEIDQAGDLPYIVMEYVEGINLKEWGQAAPRHWREVLNPAAQIAAGLQYAHAQGVIHRDIKPENLLVQADGVVKITDFGLARLLRPEEAGLTRSGTILGTLAYISPEQAAGETADARGDIFSLGVVLYELLTGRLPFRGENEAAYLYALIHDQAVPVRQASPQLPVGLEQLLEKMLQSDRHKRIQTMREVGESIKSLCNSAAE